MGVSISVYSNSQPDPDIGGESGHVMSSDKTMKTEKLASRLSYRKLTVKHVTHSEGVCFKANHESFPKVTVLC